MESLKFDLHTIKAATHNFSRDNKLGEGGFGEVYKGKLEAGQEVAVKRLSKSSGQGVQEFKTEVLLIAKLQHKNLVKLLGFCFTSQEKILVYEYLQNSSLDKFLLDSRKKLSFDWQMRFKVIVGIARGLMYLHEDSRLKIIHRDLKPSNILLDDAMVPKISDFGLAKLFEVEETEGDTKRIVGTYGYMAPEYVMTGHFSTKSDIYSFGIIVLEIVSGQKNRLSGRPQLEETLLHRAWRLWDETNPLNLVDSTLDDKYPTEDVRKCIHVGLLCIQENATERPRMTTIVAALNGQSISLPMPRAPNFFGSNGVNAEMASVHYRLPIGGEIEYRQILNRHGSPCIYSGTNNITDLCPR
ncbi:hypothetical protein Cgig2_030890 [Carnegiea gigantea]|uniref:non-specific serine/threonine protein kinase n=1 Tax=Carnegiea gigantea TaxID=171969 RepID=A0A9Q1GST6_9CARY|nr:hypothetical protein Cgig2_030890 [Carnegiea gigantea]